MENLYTFLVLGKKCGIQFRWVSSETFCSVEVWGFFLFSDTNLFYPAVCPDQAWEPRRTGRVENVQVFVGEVANLPATTFS